MNTFAAKICTETRDPGLEKTIESLSTTLLYSIFKQLARANQYNARIVCDFITAEYNEQNVKLGTRLAHIKILFSFIRYLEYKDLQRITKADVLLYLNNLRKQDSVDPSHKWIGTFKPVLRIFQNTQALNELLPVISNYVVQKRLHFGNLSMT